MNEVTEKTHHPLQMFKDDLKSLYKAGDLDVLPSNVTYDAFRNAAVVAFQDNARVQKCTRESIFRSLRKLAAAGLVPDGREAALVPFKDECTALPMVYGILKIARNTGAVKSIWGETVREGEELKVWIENGERKFDHIFDPLNRSDKVIGAFAVAVMENGIVEFKSMTLDEIEKRRKASPNQKVWENNKGKASESPLKIWKDWYPEMAIKTALHALCKGLPLSSEDQTRILEAVTEQEPYKDITPEEPSEPKPNLADQIKGKAEVQPEDSTEPLDGEVISYEESAVDPFSEAYANGQAAFKAGKGPQDNPHANNPNFSSWQEGWNFEKKQGKPDA